MVIEPLSLIFFRVPSCAAAGTATARVRAARISVIGRVMSVFSLWAVRAGGWMGRLHDSTGVPRSLSKRRRPTARRQNASGGLEFGLFLQRSEEHTSELQSLRHLV